MKKRKLGQTLYWRISLTLLILLIVLGVAYIFITAQLSRKYYEEVTQKLNSQIAAHMLAEVQPFENGKVNQEALGKIMHSMMAVNPGIEVYLVSPSGEILSFVVLDKKVKLKRIDLAPVKAFINSGGSKYILGDDPRNPASKTIFSATDVVVDGKPAGYVYIVLASEEYEKLSAALWDSYIFKIGTWSFSLTLFAALAVGLLALWYLTKNLRSIIDMVNSFDNGDLQARINVTTNDELAELSHSINHMADTIVKQLEDLKQVDSLKKELIANVSHDLRTPLSIIQGYAETLIMKKDELNAEDKDKYLNSIMSGTKRLNSLVSDLFELTKLEARQITPQKEVFAIADLLQDSMLKFQLLAKQKQVTLRVNNAEQSLMAFADVALMDRVMQNLIDNALKFTPTAGEVILEASSVDRKVEVKVSNTGEGIAEKEIPLIFDRYYKTPVKGEGAGTGLGLAIVKNILEIHGSQIGVESKPQDRTTFYFTLQSSG